jgi:hypothetical protein
MSYRYEPLRSAEDYVVVDLSQHINALMAYEDIAPLLTEDQEAKVVDYIKQLSKMSYDKISKRYDHWTEADRAHDVYVPPEATKFREKVVIADTRAIADTVLTYKMAALTGRNPMFMLEGMNRRSRVPSAILERILHQQMRRTAGEARMAQMILDGIRYGFAPTKVNWNNAQNTNQIVNFNPRKTFPDPRVSWGDWDHAQYIIFSDHITYNNLLASGLYPKLRAYPQLRHRMGIPRQAWESHRNLQEEGRGLSLDPYEPQKNQGNQTFWSLGHNRIVDEVWVRLSGYEINVPQIDEIWLLITVMDEDLVIRMQVNPYGKVFPVVYGSLHNDCHKTFGQSLYDILLPLHDIATWLLRSRIDNVQAALTNLMFVDPSMVSIPDLIDRNPWGVVRSLPGVKPGDGVFIAQVPDVTRGHWNDIAALSDLKQRVSAASDAQQGVPTSDVRSATEIQRLTQLGSQRLGVLSRISSALTVRPMVRMMVQNIQDAVAYEGSLRMDSDNTPGLLTKLVQDDYLDFNVQDIQGDIDYLVVDGTLPIEPTRSPETWMNMLTILTNTGLSMEYNQGRIAEEAIRAMGVSNLDQFKITPEQREQGLSPSQKIQLMEKMRGASVQPNEQIQQEVDRGNLVPMRPQ